MWIDFVIITLGVLNILTILIVQLAYQNIFSSIDRDIEPIKYHLDEVKEELRALKNKISYLSEQHYEFRTDFRKIEYKIDDNFIIPAGKIQTDINNHIILKLSEISKILEEHKYK